MPGRSKVEIIVWEGELLLRELWTQDGIPEDRQDAFLASIAERRRRSAIKGTTKTEENHDNNSQEKISRTLKGMRSFRPVRSLQLNDRELTTIPNGNWRCNRSLQILPGVQNKTDFTKNTEKNL